MTTAQEQTYADALTRVVAAAEGFHYAYRDVGTGAVPLVLLQHSTEFISDVERFLRSNDIDSPSSGGSDE